MNKMLILVLGAFFAVLSINGVLYSVYSPIRSMLFLIPIIFIVIFLVYVLFRRSRRSLYFFGGLSLTYSLFSIVFISISSNLYLSRWYYDQGVIDTVYENMVQYALYHGKCPKAEEVYMDKFNNKFSGRIISKNNSCTVYMLGPDGIDNNAEIVLSNDAIYFSSKVPPWNYMIFGKFILSVLGYDRYLEGDIVRKSEILINNDIH